MKLVLIWLALILAVPAAASPGWTMREYIDFKQQGPAANEKLNHYLIAVIDAIGMSNEEIIANRQTPIFCQGQRDISVDMIRTILDRWIQKTEPTKSQADWKIFVGKQNLAGAVLYSLKGAMPCR